VLFSMTGFGEARGSGPGFAVSVEVRSVNNRHLKVTVRGTDPYPIVESELEKVVRRYVRRGTLLVHVRVDRQPKPGELRLNAAALRTYLDQVRSACQEAGAQDLAPFMVAGVLALPGVAPEPGTGGGPPEDEWPVVARTLEQALQRLDGPRKEEGRAMANELLLHHRHLSDQLELIRGRMPQVMSEYRNRLLDRVRQAVADAGVTLQPDHLIREVSLFAERTDVAEEITRLVAHLDSFAELVRTGSEGAGRRLEFVVQEMGRETNTLGSKAADVSISRHVVEMKATLEKIRELVQNVE
jgi:uncharacterized protein (TIGR00255 family)